MSGWSEAGSLAALITTEVEVPRSRSGEQIKLELDEQGSAGVTSGDGPATQ